MDIVEAVDRAAIIIGAVDIAFDDAKIHAKFQPASFAHRMPVKSAAIITQAGVIDTG